jgi:D-3-phosphoglycerate dehydrogenase
MKRILITPRSLTKEGDPSLDLLRTAGCELVFCSPGKSPDEAELKRLLPGCVGWLAGVEKVTDAALSAAPELKAISRNGTGVDSIDLAACERRGVRVLRAEGANARGVAELALGLLLSLVRSIPFADSRMKAGGWERGMGSELAGRVMGVVGCGKIGRLVAGFCLAMDMEVIAFDAYPDRCFTPSPRFRFAPLAELLEKADAISLHCPHVPGEKPLMDRAVLSRIKKGAFLINTARAGLVDDAAVLEALENGRLAGYAVDAYDKEPPGLSALLSHPRVIASPHVGGYTAESVSRATRAAVENLLAAL